MYTFNKKKLADSIIITDILLTTNYRDQGSIDEQQN